MRCSARNKFGKIQIHLPAMPHLNPPYFQLKAMSKDDSSDITMVESDQIPCYKAHFPAFDVVHSLQHHVDYRASFDPSLEVKIPFDPLPSTVPFQDNWAEYFPSNLFYLPKLIHFWFRQLHQRCIPCSDFWILETSCVQT